MKHWIEDYAEGERIRTPYVRINREDILAYSRFTHDLRPVLIEDPADPSAESFVPPLYVLSVGMCLLQQAPERSYLPEELVAFLGFTEVNFPHEATTGDLIRSEAVVERTTVRDDGRGALVYWHETLNQDGEVMVSSRHSMLVRSRESQA